MSANIPQNKLYDLQLIDQICLGNQEQIKKWSWFLRLKFQKLLKKRKLQFPKKIFLE